MIKENELKLLEKDVRNNKDELKKLIARDFVEYCSSGVISTFDKMINDLAKENKDIKYKIIKMDTKRLSEEIVLVLYTIKMENGISNRSSIWKNEENSWKIIFHQGTKAQNNK
jgi:hypothetical protein